MAIIQILGTGCKKCLTLAANAEKAVSELGGGYEIVKVTDINEIMTFGVMITPALAVDSSVKSVGKVLEVEAIKKILQGE